MNPATRSPARSSRRQAFSLMILAAVAGCDASGGAVSSSAATAGDLSVAQQAIEAPVSNTYILSAVDDRVCPAPACGGYFVKLVNQVSTPCGDGTAAAECHALRLDFSATGLSAAEATRFERDAFATGTGVVQGALVRRQIDPNLETSAEDVLLVGSAWQGQARSLPKGSFTRVTPTGKLCVTFPCDSYLSDRLNMSILRSYNAIALASSGAPADAVARGNQALAGPSGVVAAGVEVLVSGPAGRGKDFSAAEFYLRVSPCAAEDARPAGTCTKFLGYKWDGAACVAISGCSCDGKACAGLPTTMAACKAEHVICTAGCGQPGRQTCSDKQYCDFPDAYACGTAAQPGECHARTEICTAISRPACGCNGKNYNNPCEAHAAGTDVAFMGPCK
jgi:hypothetical protein